MVQNGDESLTFKRVSYDEHNHENHSALVAELEAMEDLKQEVLKSSSPMEKIVAKGTKKYPSPVLGKINYSQTKEVLKKVKNCGCFVVIMNAN